MSLSSTTDVDRLLESLRNGVLIKEQEVKALCDKAREVLIEEPNLVRVKAPVSVIGDIHGQFYDLQELFRVGGDCPETNYVFLGDYVDRGYHSVETFLLLLALKVRYPDRITMLRGNHESRFITQVYGFYDECLKKYGTSNVYKYCTDVFDYLSLAAIIDERVFCVHGGLSPQIRTLDQISLINRKQEIPSDGPMSDLLWSDPDDKDEIEGWAPNPRMAGFIFGREVVKEWHEINNTELICRSHQLVREGYQYFFDDTLINVWAAPNYMYRCGNVASILELDEKLNRNIKIFDAAPVEGRNVHQPVPDYFLQNRTNF